MLSQFLSFMFTPLKDLYYALQKYICAKTIVTTAEITSYTRMTFCLSIRDVHLDFANTRYCRYIFLCQKIHRFFLFCKPQM